MTMWKTLGEVKIPDILQFVADASKEGQAVHIGTDSQQTGRHTQFVTVVVILTRGRVDVWPIAGTSCRESRPCASGC
jgi:predicted RNase H-related nuclease YkuK (DUF458 family)